MTTVVEDDEKPDRETSGQYGNWNREPERNRNEKVHQVPQDGVRNQGVDELPDGMPNGRFLIFGDDVSPGLMSGDSVGDRDFAHRKF